VRWDLGRKERRKRKGWISRKRACAGAGSVVRLNGAGWARGGRDLGDGCVSVCWAVVAAAAALLAGCECKTGWARGSSESEERGGEGTKEWTGGGKGGRVGWAEPGAGRRTRPGQVSRVAEWQNGRVEEQGRPRWSSGTVGGAALQCTHVVGG
jgi:hypothetical protein